jgi:hypothetical protein
MTTRNKLEWPGIDSEKDVYIESLTNAKEQERTSEEVQLL